MAFEAVLFDFDGLILDTETSEYVTVRDEFELHGLELPLEEWQKIIGRADNPHWLDWLETELGRPLEQRAVVQERRRQAHHTMIAAEDVRPGVVALLDEADARGIPTGIASSSPLSWVEPHLERIGIRDRFAVVRTIDHVERGKPWPELFLAAAAALGATPHRCVALEDSHNGSLAAKAAGMVTVVVPNDMTRGQDFSHADVVLESLADVDLDRLPARSRR